ncbi:MAG: ABC transporter permease [Betaproteobacteria bacterium]
MKQFFSYKNLAGIGGILIFILLWESTIRLGSYDFEFIVSPSQIAAAWLPMLLTANFWNELTHTLTAALIGWLLAAICGIILGISMGLSSRLRQCLMASFELLRPLPGVAFAPVGLILFGFSLKMELLVIFFPTLWPIVGNTLSGIDQQSNRLHELVKIYHIPPLQAAFSIYGPAAAASILVGLRISASLAVIMAVIAEMIGNPEGLGYAIIREQQGLHPAEMFAYIITLGVIGILVNQLLIQLAKWLMPGQFLRTTS